MNNSDKEDLLNHLGQNEHGNSGENNKDKNSFFHAKWMPYLVTAVVVNAVVVTAYFFVFEPEIVKPEAMESKVIVPNSENREKKSYATTKDKEEIEKIIVHTVEPSEPLTHTSAGQNSNDKNDVVGDIQNNNTSDSDDDEMEQFSIKSRSEFPVLTNGEKNICWIKNNMEQNSTESLIKETNAGVRKATRDLYLQGRDINIKVESILNKVTRLEDTLNVSNGDEKKTDPLHIAMMETRIINSLKEVIQRSSIDTRMNSGGSVNSNCKENRVEIEVESKPEIINFAKIESIKTEEYVKIKYLNNKVQLLKRGDQIKVEGVIYLFLIAVHSQQKVIFFNLRTQKLAIMQGK
jgi:hypothetical protein